MTGRCVCVFPAPLTVVPGFSGGLLALQLQAGRGHGFHIVLLCPVHQMASKPVSTGLCGWLEPWLPVHLVFFIWSALMADGNITV